MKGIWFDDVHSFEHLNLVLSEVNIPPAVPKTNFIDIPGGDGSIDLTEAHGDVKYKSREGSATFTAFPSDDFEAKKTEVSNLLNGKRCKITLDKDPDYYYLGRCAVDEYKSDKNVHQIVVVFTVDPYKLKQNPTIVTVPAGNGTTANSVKLLNGRKSVVPTIDCVAETTLFIYDQKNSGAIRYVFSPGTHKDLSIVLTEGMRNVSVLSTGSVTFTYQEGDL